MTHKLPRFLIPAAVAFALLVPALQSILDIGLSPAEFARDGNATLRAAGYGFSIWSLIYAGLIAYAVWQALPANRDDARLHRIGPWALIAIVGCGLWIAASAMDLQWASVAIILTSAAAITAGLLRAAPAHIPLKHRLLAWWPLSLLAGWLTLASALNLMTVLTSQGLLEGVQKAAAFTGLITVLIIALFVLHTGRLAVFAAPLVWGLAAVWVAERSQKPDIAAFAIGAAILIGCYAAWQGRPAAKRRDATSV